MTKHAPKPKPDDAEQSRRFIDAAKEAGVDESGKVFEKAFKKIAPEKTAPKRA
jgi:hypothetical protein